MHIDKLINKSLTTHGMVKGNIDSNTLNTWLKKTVVLKLPSKSIIIMNNTIFHKNMRTSVD